MGVLRHGILSSAINLEMDELFPRGSSEAPADSSEKKDKKAKRRGEDVQIEDRCVTRAPPFAPLSIRSESRAACVSSLFSTHKWQRNDDEKKGAKKSKKQPSQAAEPGADQELLDTPGIGDALIASPRKGVPPKLVPPSFKSFTRGVLTLGVVRRERLPPRVAPPLRERARDLRRATRRCGASRKSTR